MSFHVATLIALFRAGEPKLAAERSHPRCIDTTFLSWPREPRVSGPFRSAYLIALIRREH